MEYDFTGRNVVIRYTSDDLIDSVFITQTDDERRELVHYLESYFPELRVDWFHAQELI